jgi:hypothetical protein
VHLVGGALGRLGDHLGLLLELWKFLFEGRKGRERGMSFIVSSASPSLFSNNFRNNEREKAERK